MISLFPAASNLMNFLSAVIMPNPLASHFKAHARVCESGSAATFAEQFTSTTATLLNLPVAHRLRHGSHESQYMRFYDACGREAASINSTIPRLAIDPEQIWLKLLQIPNR